MSAREAIIEESLERLAEKAGDPTSAVYAHLFARYPDLEPLFVRDLDGAVRGEMLAKVFECAMDLAGPNAYAANFLRCEMVNHEGVGVPPEVFPRFFQIAVETFRDLLGPDWADDYDAAWASLVAEVNALVASPA